MTEPITQIVPIILGDTDQLNLWKKLRSAVDLSPTAQMREGILANIAEIVAQIQNVLTKADIVILMAGAAWSKKYLMQGLNAISPLLRDLKLPLGLVVVFESAEQSSDFGGRLQKMGVEVLGDNNSTQLSRVLEKFAQEIQNGSRLPVASYADLAVSAVLEAAIGAKSLPSAAVSESAAATDLVDATIVTQSPEAEVSSQEEDDQGEAGQQQLLSFEELNSSEFTSYAWRVLEVARRLGDVRPRSQSCTLRRLLASLFLHGFAYDENAGAWLLSQIPLTPNQVQWRLESLYPVIARNQSFDTLLKLETDVSPFMTKTLRRTIDLARRLATEDRTGRETKRISVRHLLGATLAPINSGTSAVKLLKSFHLDVDKTLVNLIQELAAWGVKDDIKVWQSVLNVVWAQPEVPRLPNYSSDSVTGPDLIGITREVEAMASLACAWSVEPPLSIGLFGEWGSGKSFFMQQMKERVRQIATEARKAGKAGKGQKEFGYYRNIVQVEFNAWHYVEGNLWASLVEHIFCNLRLEGIGEENLDSEQHIRSRLEKLLGELKGKNAEADQKQLEAQELSREAEEKKTQSEAQAEKLQAEAEEAKKRASKAEEEQRDAELKAATKQREADDLANRRESFGIKDMIEEVQGSAEIRKWVGKDMETFGFTSERMATVQGLRESLKEATETSTILGEGIKILINDKQRWRLLVWVIAVPTILAGLVWIGGCLIKHQSAPWLQSIIALVSSLGAVITGVVGGWKRYSQKLQPIVAAVKRLRQQREILELRVEKSRQERAETAAKLDTEARKKRLEVATETKLAAQKMAEAESARLAAKQKQAEADRAKEAAQTARVEAERLQAEAGALMPERRIAAFIEDRAGAKDYRQHLGVPALIRRDFEKLSAMFNTQRDDESLGRDAKINNDPSIVNRIILYIDDLDRCPPKEVVEVLRAIHLLLAFPLFVVIVAVDARWMKLSLRDQFSLMLTSPNNEGANHAKVKEDQLALGPLATPDDYLEKIFQVPFWIRPLNKSSCENLVDELTRHDAEDQNPAPSIKDRPKTTPVVTANPGQGNEVPTPGNAGRRGESENPVTGEKLPSGSLPTAAKPPEIIAPGTTFKWSPVEASPRTLKLLKEEREYMVELAAIIGRSPRSVKRFVNCYRLLKLALDKGDPAQSNRNGTFRATMLLLAMVTGLPDIAPALIADLRQAELTISPVEWAQEAAKGLHIGKRERWGDMMQAIVRIVAVSNVSTIAPLVEASYLVDRFSFSPVRSHFSQGQQQDQSES